MLALQSSCPHLVLLTLCCAVPPWQVVIAFRGTASMANVKADMQVGAGGGCRWPFRWLLACCEPSI